MLAQSRAGELGEETLDQVRPGAVLGCKGELEAALGLGGEPSFRLPGDLRRMIIEDQLDRRIRRIGGVEELEEFGVRDCGYSIFNQGIDFAGEQIDPGQ